MKKMNLALLTLIAPLLLVGCNSTEDKEDTPTKDAYVVTFVVDENCSIKWYDTNDTDKTPVAATKAYSLDKETGEHTFEEGQVTFVIEYKEGYEANGLPNVSGTKGVDYNDLKTPRDTGKDNVYKITKIASDLTVTVNSKEEEAVKEGYKVTFNVEGGKVGVYASQDYSVDPVITNSTETVNPDTGEKTKDSELAQINFVIIPNEGYSLPTADDITITGSFKNLKDRAEDGDGIWRVTKIASDLVITIVCLGK